MEKMIELGNNFKEHEKMEISCSEAFLSQISEKMEKKDILLVCYYIFYLYLHRILSVT